MDIFVTVMKGVSRISLMLFAVLLLGTTRAWAVKVGIYNYSAGPLSVIASNTADGDIGMAFELMVENDADYAAFAVNGEENIEKFAALLKSIRSTYMELKATAVNKRITSQLTDIEVDDTPVYLIFNSSDGQLVHSAESAGVFRPRFFVYRSGIKTHYMLVCEGSASAGDHTVKYSMRFSNVQEIDRLLELVSVSKIRYALTGNASN